MRICTSIDTSTCEKALIYGYNLEGTGIDEDDDVVIAKIAEFQRLCDAGSTDNCSQIEAGYVFQYGNIASAVL
eukprot:CAMPEP_0201578078 /NCGR_PEP_ID=MMETSP0190_2-20130828/24784_1 /ASSEMBLY_ACC=CAM_ASM_000263 /TAXON_ID=37353 /ORGANISM="Rosalina sp." /LENGTH=72 /DNA_ID=CAMNT_0048010853 /DNA_START=149 /DNA_END=364 /DNA_ORIENTATION=+